MAAYPFGIKTALMNWLKENWFKLGILVFLIAIASVYFVQQNNRQSLESFQNEMGDGASLVNANITDANLENGEAEDQTNANVNSPVPPTNSQANSNQAAAPKVTTYSDGYVEDDDNGVAGWAFDNNTALTVNLAFKEISRGYEVTTTGFGNTNSGSSGSFYFSFRKDIEALVQSKGITPYVRTGFQLNIKGGVLPTGYYTLSKATYNGKNFKISNPSKIYHFEKCGIINGYYVCN
jgi:hypothetical protein